MDDLLGVPTVQSPRSYSSTALHTDEERNVGIPEPARPRAKSHSIPFAMERPKPRRRPTAVRVRPMLDEKTLRTEQTRSAAPSIRSNPSVRSTSSSERTPLIKAGVRQDLRRTADEVETQQSEAKAIALGRMVEVGLPLVMYVGREPLTPVRTRSAARSSASAARGTSRSLGPQASMPCRRLCRA